MHPNDGGPANPFPYLNKATRLLFAAPPGSAVTLSLKGTVLLSTATTLKMKVATATVFPVGITLLGLRKPVVLTMTKVALVGRASLRAGKTAIVLTQPAKTSLETQAADDGVFSVARIVARLATLEDRLALLGKGAHAFLLVLGREQRSEEDRLVRKAGGEVALEGPVRRVLRGRERNRGFLRQ